MCLYLILNQAFAFRTFHFALLFGQVVQCNPVMGVSDRRLQISNSTRNPSVGEVTTQSGSGASLTYSTPCWLAAHIRLATARTNPTAGKSTSPKSNCPLWLGPLKFRTVLRTSGQLVLVLSWKYGFTLPGSSHPSALIGRFGASRAPIVILSICDTGAGFEHLSSVRASRLRTRSYHRTFKYLTTSFRCLGIC